MAVAYHDTRTRPALAASAVDWGIFVLRLALGIIFVAHGAQKVFGLWGGPGLEGTVQGFGQMGIAAPLAYIAAFTELLGGVALIVGLFSRLAALGVIVLMIVATLKVHLPNGFFLGAAPGFEYNFALAAMALSIFIIGPGRIAISDWDRWLVGRK